MLVLLGLGLAAAAGAASVPPVEVGQTPDQVRSGLGKPDHVSVAVEAGRNVEVWSYQEPYWFFWLECDTCAPRTAMGQLEQSQPLACEERARVVFINGRVAAFLARD